MNIILVGLMGAGKSTVGPLLAQQLGCSYAECDTIIVERAGKSIPEIFATLGEPAFRTLERQVISDLLQSPDLLVISPGGGIVLDTENRRFMHEYATVIWLRTSVATLAHRVGDGAGRPVLAGDPAGNLPRLLQERQPLYKEIAHITVDTDALTPAEVTKNIVAQLGV